ncbi:MAG: glycosyltransferase family 2 protein [Rikenellaceae bacterium]|nr:glycosyltransferase family 2 protein [Rikenellaceae bacterium]
MITASIVTYHHSAQEIGRVMDCVLNSPVDKVYIVDNSRNDALRILEKLSERIRYIHNANIGYGGAHNIAMREALEAGADYHVIVNPDIWFGPGVIETLASYMERHPEAGMVSPKVVYPNGDLQYLCKLLPTPFDLILRRFLPSGFLEASQHRFELRFTGYDREMDVPYLSGCFMFLRTATLKKSGLFDERFFMYGEDIDMSRRIHAISRTMYYPGADIIHAHAAASYKSKKMLWVHIKNLIWYFNKWGWIADRQRRQVNKACLEALQEQSERNPVEMHGD